MSESTTYYSNGKLLLTGEYVVLDGAAALAVPTKLGQSLQVVKTEQPVIHWKSITNNNECWFEGFFNLATLDCNIQNPIAQKLTAILKTAKSMNPDFLSDKNGYKVVTKLDFDREWGLGSSSTLINNIAAWAEINAFTLLEKSFGGSGYDIAAAQSDSAIIFQKNKNNYDVREVFLNWDFKEKLYFIHLNKKQDSKEGITTYRSKAKDTQIIKAVSAITNKLLMCYSLADFEVLLQAHEQHISNLTGLPTVKSLYFSDYSHTVKSLGAWGGDFVLAVVPDYDPAYFLNKGYHTIIPYKEMLL